MVGGCGEETHTNLGMSSQVIASNASQIVDRKITSFYEAMSYVPSASSCD